MQVIGIGSIGSEKNFRYNAEAGVFNFSAAFNLFGDKTVWVDVAAWGDLSKTLSAGVEKGWFTPGKPLLLTLDVSFVGLEEYQGKQYLRFKTKLIKFEFLPVSKQKSEESASKTEEDPKDFSF